MAITQCLLPGRCCAAAGKPSTSGRVAATAAARLWRSGPAPVQHGCPRTRFVCSTAAADPETEAYTGERFADEEYMKEYQALKDGLYDNTRKCGGAIAAYLLLTADGGAALCALLGTAGSCLYLTLLYRDVDSYQWDTVVPFRRAEEMEPASLRMPAKILAGYLQALRPRLLVPVGLAAMSGAVNLAAGPGQGLDLLHQGCLLGGFLAYKVALLIKLIDELTPKTYNEGAFSRPRVEQIDDELDQYGRPRRPMLRMPTEALPEGAEPEKNPLATLILAADASMGESADEKQERQRQGQQGAGEGSKAGPGAGAAAGPAPPRAQ